MEIIKNWQENCKKSAINHFICGKQQIAFVTSLFKNSFLILLV